jgi:hypothetical protein
LKPKIVETAEKVPARCIVSSEIDGPFIDTGTYAGEMDPYIYLSVAYVTEVARDLLGMVPKQEVDDLNEQVNAMKVKLEQIEKVEDAVKVIREFETEQVLS